MPVMNIRHVSMFMLGVWMLVHMGMRFSCRLIHRLMLMKLIAPGMPVFVHDRHMNMEMSMFFVCQ